LKDGSLMNSTYHRNFRVSRNVPVDNLREEVVCSPLQIVVTGSFEDAFRRFKTLVQSEGIVNNYKARQAYEKPSIKKRRKQREAHERRLMQAAREAQMLSGEWDRRQRVKEAKRLEKMEERKKQRQGDA
jgi:small subunit ribosomal protein S21